MIRGFAAGLALVVLALATPSRAAPPTPDELLARAERASAEMQTLAGEFTQRNRLKLFKQELTSHGKLSFRRPRQIRWEYTKPDPSVLVLDDKVATLAAPGAPPQRFDLERDPTMRLVFDQLLMWMGAGAKDKGALTADYALSTTETKGQPTLVLQPLATSPISKVFTRIELRFDAAAQLKSLLLIERAGDEKEITFTKLVKNAKLPADAFVAPTK